MIDQNAQQSRLKTHDVFICYIGQKTDAYSNPLIEELSKNHAEFHIQDLKFLNQKVGCAHNLHSALRLAKKSKCKYLLYVQIGNVVDWADGITEYIRAEIDKYNNNIQFIGHVLQRDNGSFYIHPQFCLFDVNWALTNGIRDFDKAHTRRNSSYVYERSSENFHDSYTPIWVKPTTESKKFDSAGCGVNVLNAIAETNANIGVWPREVRDRKKFVYPTVPQEVEKHKYVFLNEMDTARAYVGNTEDIRTNKYQRFIESGVQKIFTPASGLNTFLLAYYFKAKHTTAYDISNVALNMMQTYIDQWDGTNYKEFFYDVIAPSKVTDNYYKGTGIQLDQSQKLLEDIGNEFTDWWQENKTTFNIATINLLDQYTWHQFKKHSFLGDVPTLLNMSNIFHYAPTATFYPLDERVKILKNLREYWAQNVVSRKNMLVHGLNPVNNDQFQGPIRDKDLEHNITFPWRN